MFLDLYSLHSGSFPNNEFKRVLGTFTASSQLNVPTCILFATDHAQLRSVQIRPDKWLGPYTIRGLRLWDETVVSEGGAWSLRGPQKERKYGKRIQQLQWREFNTLLTWLLPYFRSWGRSCRRNSKGSVVCSAIVNAPVSSWRGKVRFFFF